VVEQKKINAFKTNSPILFVIFLISCISMIVLIFSTQTTILLFDSIELNPSPVSQCSAYTILLGCFTFSTMLFNSILRGNQYEFLGAVLISISIL